MNIQAKYDTLSKDAQKKVDAFIELIAKQAQPGEKKADLSAWKQKIKNVSVWSDEDVSIMERNSESLGEWEVQEW